MKAISYSIFIILLAGCASIPIVNPLKEVNTSNIIAFYQLPDTEIIIDVPIKKFPSKYIPCMNNKSVQAKDSIITTRGTVGKNIYAVLGNSNPLQDTSFQITYGKNYTLAESKAETNDKTTDYFVTFLQAAATIAPVLLDASNENRACSHAYISDTGKIQKKLQRLHDQKIDTISGKNPGSATDNIEVLKYRVAEIENEIRNITDEHIGIASYSISKSVVPDKEKIMKIIGYLDKETLLYREDDIDIESSDNIQSENNWPVLLKITRLNDDFSNKLWNELQQRKDEQSTNKRSYYYRISGQALVEISFIGYKVKDKSSGQEEDLTIRKVAPVAQYGFIRSLPSLSSGSSASAKITLNEETGDLLGIELGSKANSPTFITDASKASADLIKTIKEIELLRLQNRSAILEERAKIATALKTLNNSK